MQIDQNMMGKGAVERPWDLRNISYSAFFPDTGNNADVFDWDLGFDLSKEVPFLIKNQNGSPSCVGQGWSYYAEALNYKETGIFTPLSPRFIYARIHLPEGGAFGYKGADIMESLGISTELSVPSYENGLPPGESFMNIIDSRPEVMKEALIYRGKDHAYVKNTFDAMAQAIRNQYGMTGGINGSNQGVSLPQGFIRPPLMGEALWGHWLFFVGAMKINGKKYLKFINSWSDQWGDAGFGYVGEDYLPYMFNSITLIDLPNDYIKPMTLVMLVGAKDIWLVRDGKRSLVYNVSAFQLIGGNIDQVQKLTADQFNAIPDSGTVLAGIPQE